MRLSQAPRHLVGKLGLGLAAFASLAAPAAVQAQSTGTIKGRLVWAGATIPTPKVEASAAASKDAVCKVKPILSKEMTIDPATKGIADAFVYLVKPTGDYGAATKELVGKKPEVVVDQINCEYVPYATFVQTDQKLVFKSSDPVGHNVDFKPSNNSPINQMLVPNGKMPYTIKEGERRPAKAICSIHPWMAGYVLILEHPLAAVTKPDGTFEITGVPAGTQQLIVWQSNAGYVHEGGSKGMAVKVTPGGVTDLGDFKISKMK